MDWTCNAKIAAVKLKHLSGLIWWVGGSLLRCNYYHEYLACEEKDFSERYILLEGEWELLSGERLVILLKISQLQLNGTWKAKPVPKWSHLVSQNKLIHKWFSFLIILSYTIFCKLNQTQIQLTMNQKISHKLKQR